MLKKCLFTFLTLLLSINLFSQDVTPSGAFTYTYPIEIPEGINGIQPNISLTYNSQAGNGIAGMGWTLNGFPTITRDTTYPINWNDTDHFIYNGQRLIKQSGSSTIYHTENKSFERIYYDGNSWTVTQKNGTKMYFGNTLDSKIEAVGKTQARVWALNKVEDVNGNYYEIKYDEYSTGDYYPSHIKYTSNDNNNYQGINEVIFDYKERNNCYSSNISNPFYYKKLSSISIYFSYENNRALYNKYIIEYFLPNSIGTIQNVEKVKKIKSDIAGDSVEFDWNFSKENYYEYQGDWTHTSSPDVIVCGTPDADGDGVSDLLLQYDFENTRRWQVRLSNGKEYVKTDNWAFTTSYDVKFCGTPDANGDGLADLLLEFDVEGNRFWQVRLSNGKEYVKTDNWAYTTSYDVKFRGTPDANGDGLADLLLEFDVEGNRFWQVRLSNGEEYVKTDNWAFTTSYDVKFRGTPDANGDGLADLLLEFDVEDNRFWQVRLSNGKEYIKKDNWAFTSSYDVKFRGIPDANGDGLPDLLLQYDSSGNRGWQIRTSFNNIDKVIKKVTLSNGSCIIPKYEFSNIKNSSSPHNSLFPFISNKYPRQLVSSLTIENGQDKSYTTSYKYYNGKIKTGYRHERKSLGFEWIEKTNPNGTSVKTYYYQEENDSVYAGAVKRQETYDKDGKLYTVTEQNYSVKEIQAKSGDAHSIKHIKKVSDVSYNFNGIAFTDWDSLKKNLINVEKLITQKDYKYDDFGNVTEVYNHGDKSTTVDDSLSLIKYAINNTNGNYIFVPYQTKMYSYPLEYAVTNQKIAVNESFLSEHKDMYYDDFFVLGRVGTKGQLTRKIEHSGGDSPNLETNFAYNNFGNLKTVSDAQANTSEIIYDDVYKNSVNQKKNALGQVVTQYEYDELGRVKWEKDINDEYTWYKYDIKNRVTNISKGTSIAPGRDLVRKEYSDIKASHEYPKWIKEDIYSPTKDENNYVIHNYLTTYTFFDNFGNKLQTKTQGFDKDGNSGWVIVSYDVDNIKGITKITKPIFEQSNDNGYREYTASEWEYLKPTTEYKDPIGRVEKIEASDGSKTFYKYGLKDKVSLTVNSGNKSVFKYETIDGRTKSEFSYPEGSTTDIKSFVQGYWVYRNDVKSAFNGTELTEIVKNSVGTSSNTITTKVDLLGRKTEYTDPNMGTWKYVYDENSNLKKQTDANENTVEYEYDALNRVTTKIAKFKNASTETDELKNHTILYFYDGAKDEEEGKVDNFNYGKHCKGQLTKVRDDINSFSETYYYDNSTSTYEITKTIGTETRKLSTTLDAVGKIQSEKLSKIEKGIESPVETLTYSHRSDGNVIGLSGRRNSNNQILYISGISYNIMGKVEEYILGNNSKTDYIYNNKFQLSGLDITSSNNSKIAQMNFEYDFWGNIIFKQFDDGEYNFDETYTYDNLFRLTKAKSINNLYGVKDFYYDSLNNITQKDGYTYQYNSSKPHAVTDIVDGSSVLKNYTYDKNGNVTKIIGQSQLLIRAKTPEITNEPAKMELWLGGDAPAKTWVITSTEYKDYTWHGIIPESSKINITFNYDTEGSGTKPQLNIDNMIINGVMISPDSNQVMYINGNSIDNTGRKTLIVPSSLEFSMPSNTQNQTILIEYDSENRVHSVTDSSGLTSTYYYDDSGQRIKKEEGDIITYYFFENYEEIYIEDKQLNKTLEKSITYYHVNGQKIAYTENDGSSDKTFYYHSDHLGSAVRITNQVGTIIQSIAYDPFGRVAWLSGEENTNYTYTGQESDKTGFMYYNARYYDPSLGRFLQADTYLDGMNRYTYCGNNPIIYVDPTGHFFWIPAAIGAGIGAIAGGVITAVNGGDPGEIVLGALAGAGVGALAGLTGGAMFTTGMSLLGTSATVSSVATLGSLTGAASGAIAGGGFMGIHSVSSGNELGSDQFWSDVGTGAWVGAAIGGTLGAYYGGAYADGPLREELNNEPDDIPAKISTDNNGKEVITTNGGWYVFAEDKSLLHQFKGYGVDPSVPRVYKFGHPDGSETCWFLDGDTYRNVRFIDYDLRGTYNYYQYDKNKEISSSFWHGVEDVIPYFWFRD